MKDYGRLWEVDLTTGKVTKDQISQDVIRLYLGGRGLGARLLLDYLKPGTDPLAPENVLMFISGPLTGTPAPGAGKYLVVTKSPATGAWLESYASGRLALELRYSGCDVLMIRGRAAQPSYLWVGDGAAEVRDARDLWGSDAFRTEEILARRFGDPAPGIACIGPAGENLIRFAGINSDFFRQAGRGGAGAVMGSKNLKAVVARGTKGLSCADSEGVLSLLSAHIDRVRGNPVAVRRRGYGTSLTMNATNEYGMLPTLNYQRGTAPEAGGRINAEGVGKAAYHTRGCTACITPCGVMTHTQGPLGDQYLEGPEYETLCLLGSNLGVFSLPYVCACNLLCDQLGLDTISTGNVIGFAMECFERGLIGTGDTGGRDLRFGRSDLVPGLIRDIAYMRGFGRDLSLGTRSLAAQVGQGSERWAIHVKGLEFSAYDPRAAFGGGLIYAVAPRGACHRRSSPVHVVRRTSVLYEPDGQARVVKDLFDERSIQHTVLVCDFIGRGAPVSADEYGDYLGFTIGEHFTGDELQEIADRIETTIRLFNNREGLSRSDDTLPPRILEEPLPDGPARGKIIGRANLDRMLDEYYQLRGWDPAGVPTKETVSRLQINPQTWLSPQRQAVSG
ncbi:MAG: aldehyde ferredoxin oxidoreductase family protein [Firmicutes bacterium]|nr:aldehyde ferredoxin oxidoreductase family protein [Bacillota bacterium]